MGAGDGGWSRLDGWGAVGPRPWGADRAADGLVSLGKAWGFDILATPEVAEAVERAERLARLGLLGADAWMGTGELAKELARPAED